MRSMRSVVIALFLVTSVAVSALGSYYPALPGKNEPQRLRWKGRTVKISISNSIFEPSSNIKSDSDVAGAIRRSIAAWQAVAEIEIQSELSDKKSISPSGVIGDGTSLITIAQSAENVLLFSKEPQAEAAKTRVFYNTKKNFITEADIVLNPFQQFSTDGTYGTFDLESTLTHEIGHMLGLGHSGVLGSTMSGSLAKNGILNIAGSSARSLADNDVAAIRDLYGRGTENESCCASISGKLTTATGKAAKSLRVWAEESSTGRVVADVDVAADGNFRLGGLSSGTYSVFWRNEGDLSRSSVGDLGTFKLDSEDSRTLNEKITTIPSDVTLSYVGINSQLSDSALALTAGREYSIYLGGKNIERGRVAVEFNSPFITVAPNSVSDEDFGREVSVINFTVSVHADTPPGVYSIFATRGDGSMSSLVGALKVQ